MLDTYLKDLPLIAILRGVTPDEIVAVGRALHDAGFRVIEIPLNSPHPYESIRRLTAELGESCLIGAGTVLTEAQVAEVDAAVVRLDAGTYGVCERCGRRIAAGPLEARPTARLCIECASKR